MIRRDPGSLCIALLGVGMLAAGIILPTHIKGAKAAQSSNTGSPLVTTGVPAPMLYGQSDPVTAGQPCAGDPSRLGIAYYNLSAGIARPIWICNGTGWIQAQAAISGVTGTITGGLVLLGSPVTTRIAVAGVNVGNNCLATRADGAFSPVGLNVDAVVQVTGSVDVRLSTPLASVTSTSSVYNIRCFQ